MPVREFDANNETITVSEFIQSLNAALKELKAKIIGEVISIKHHTSGHVYFTLKDKEENAVIDCAMWQTNYRLNGLEIEVGQELIVTGYPSIYPVRGSFSFITRTAEFAGEGALKKAYEELKRKLTQEGLFEEANKRTLPRFPQRIGIITSKQGAVIHDFGNNLGKHGYKITFIDSRVEGKEAIYDLLASLKRMAKEDIDVLVVMRGGGSLQSLAAFDNEAVVRAINDFPVPVIAAIGHHQDVPLSAIVADCMVSTPTAAAHVVSTDWDNAEKSLQQITYRLLTEYKEVLIDTKNLVERNKESIEGRFERILVIFSEAKNGIKRNLERMTAYLSYNQNEYLTSYLSKLRYDRLLNQTELLMAHYEQIVKISDPMRMLRQGYSIMKKNGVVVKTINNVTIGDTVEVLVSDGSIATNVQSTKQTKHE